MDVKEKLNVLNTMRCNSAYLATTDCSNKKRYEKEVQVLDEVMQDIKEQNNVKEET